MPPTFLLAAAFVGAALLAPVVSVVALVLLVRAEWWPLGHQLLAWGALGAASCAAGLGFDFALGEAATLGGILAGAGAGYTTGTFVVVVQRAWRSWRVRGAAR